MTPLEITINLIRNQYQLGARADNFTRETSLVESLPEFNSMTVVGLVGAIEEQLGVEIDDTEINAKLFETVGSLADFVASKLD